ncbi:hypothetical protein D3P08_03655 [Paenibacillus nanensis]|uniref:MarR family transcriptional regulator n=1 Tax=Paenibacillus nanensis TaxID=393251 RepID=A0A3A1VL72_9BACL|nr:hypothetical protein [Paenibacillus nanensis]RIX59263.1 hypothetical protein D3P08_03655 [Paenibacillus nanensis]
MLTDRARKMQRILFNLYRHEAVYLDRQRLAWITGLSEAEIDTVIYELEEQGHVVQKEGLLQVIEGWEHPPARMPNFA